MDDELNPLMIGEMPEEYIELEDGSVEILTAETGFSVSGFQDNLAEVFDDHTLNQLGSEFCELLERDKESRKKRDEQYEEGIRRTGLGNDAPGGAEFEGASKVVHPVLVEACVDFSSRAIKELFPASGPVKSQTIGEHNPQKTERASRKARFMNWQLTTQIEEYRDELEQLLTQLPMGGSQFQKFWFDNDLNRIRCEFVPVDDILLPFAASNFYTSPRATHRQYLTRMEFQRRVRNGMYRDVFVGPDPHDPERSATSVANDKIEGREENGYNEDGLREVFEIYAWYEFDGDELTEGNSAPYIITIDKDTEKVLAIYRNWKEEDVRFRKLDWFVEWKFVPWRGAYAIGLPHIIGGMSGALTGALRALLDSAHINNAASMLKLKSGRVIGQNKQVNITEVTEIDAPPGVDDIRKIAMPMPFNPPSPVLVTLMDKLYGLAKGVVASTNENVSNIGDRTPVGTTMAVIEQGAAVYSAVHARLHHSQKKALEIVHRLNATFLDESFVVEELGEQVVVPEDFTGTMDVVPVSDPTIFSEAQRFAQTQAIVQMSADQSVPWNKINVYRRALKQMRVEDVDSLLPGVKEPITADITTENFEGLKGTPLKSGLDQNHLAHINGHLSFVVAPLQINNPLVPPQALMAIIAHIGEHIQHAQEQLLKSLGEPGVLTHGSMVMAQLAQTLAPTMQQIQQVQQALQQRMPQPPLPPEVQASLQIAQMDTQRKAQYDQGLLQIKSQEMQANMQSKGMEQQIKVQQSQAELALEQQIAASNEQFKSMELQIKAQFDQQSLVLQRELENLRQQVELMKNERDNNQKQETEIIKNTDDNETKIAVEYIRVGNQPEPKGE